MSLCVRRVKTKGLKKFSKSKKIYEAQDLDPSVVEKASQTGYFWVLFEIPDVKACEDTILGNSIFKIGSWMESDSDWFFKFELTLICEIW